MSELDFSYRIVDIELPFVNGKEGLYNKQVKKIAQQVSSLTGGPAAMIKRNGKFCIAIPSDRHLEETKIDVAPFTATVKMLDGINQIDSSRVTNANMGLIEKFLDFEIRRQLSNNNQLWKLNSNQFFRKVPLVSNDQSSIDVFGGFVYKLVKLADGFFYVCLDLTTKYIEKQFLSKQITAANAQVLSSRFRKRRVLYQNGDQWYNAEIVGFGNKISDHEFSLNGEAFNVFDYINQKVIKGKTSSPAQVEPGDIALLYKYPGRTMEPHSGATSLARIIYNTHDKEAKTLHRQSIKDPSRRFEAINKNIGAYFGGLSFNKKPLRISTAPLVDKVKSFPMPELKFNNGKILKVGHYSDGGNTQLREYGSERKQQVWDNGVLNKTFFDEQFLIVPEYLGRELISAFKKNAEWQISKLAANFGSFKIITYKVLEGQAATYQIQEIEKALQKQQVSAGFALFILPDLTFDSKRQIKTFHDCLKNKFYPDLKLQCASASKIRSFFESYPSVHNPQFMECRVPEEKKPKFKSYMFNLALEHLIVNRKWPFALANNPHYDIYIGIDVHDRHAGFTFFFGNGEHIFFFPVEVPKKNRSQRAEKLKSDLLTEMMYGKLKQLIPLYAPDPNGIVILRDGRSFGEEEKALEKVLSSLGADGIIKTDSLKFGVVDLHKQSAVPLRIASQTNSYNKLENPITGAYRPIGDLDGFLFNTGYPFQNPGSAKPLHLSLVKGNVEFIKVLEDVFGQSMLAFSAPDRSNSLPITIKLIDTLLEPLSGSFELVDQDQEYEDIEVDEL